MLTDTQYLARAKSEYDAARAAALSSTRKDFSHDVGYRNRRLGVDQAVMLSVTRDSDALARSNWIVITRDLQDRFGDEIDFADESILSGWHIERFNHWAHGWVDHLIVTIPAQYDENWSDDSTPFLLMQDWNRRLDHYPVANDDHYSSLEYDEAHHYLSDEIRLYRSRGFLRARAPHSDSVIAAYVLHNVLDYGDNNMPGDDEISAILRAKGWLAIRAYNEAQALRAKRLAV